MTSKPEQNYYTVLDVPRDADTREIRRAYRRLAQTVHPDADGGSAERFMEISDAYQTLIDPDRRRVYDAYLKGLTLARMATRPPATTTATPATAPRTDGDLTAGAMFFDAPDVEEAEAGRSRRSGRRQTGWRRLISSGATRSH